MALARALAARPCALLLDEPLSAVDPEAREALQDVLRRVCRERRLPVLHVTHDRDEAFALADECAVMIAGRLHQTGRPLDVLRRPADGRVARFLGARNVLRASRDPRDPRLAHVSAELSLRVADPLPTPVTDVVIRPEDLECWPTGGAPPASVNIASAAVSRLVLQVGHVLVGTESTVPLDALVTSRRADDLRLRLGMPLELTVKPDHIHTVPVD